MHVSIEFVSDHHTSVLNLCSGKKKEGNANKRPGVLACNLPKYILGMEVQKINKASPCPQGAQSFERETEREVNTH